MWLHSLPSIIHAHCFLPPKSVIFPAASYPLTRMFLRLFLPPTMITQPGRNTRGGPLSFHSGHPEQGQVHGRDERGTQPSAPTLGERLKALSWHCIPWQGGEALLLTSSPVRKFGSALSGTRQRNSVDRCLWSTLLAFSPWAWIPSLCARFLALSHLPGVTVTLRKMEFNPYRALHYDRRGQATWLPSAKQVNMGKSVSETGHSYTNTSYVYNPCAGTLYTIDILGG